MAKRSRSIRLVLVGGLSAGALGGCGPSANQGGTAGTGPVYTNNSYLPGVGYFHAPFRSWYAHPYNHFDPQTQRYFYGGQWGASPHRSITNLSEPTAEAARLAQAQRTDVQRSGFGSTARHYPVYS
jgi:hypothetical protein